jgi:hypothetical protein
MSAICGLLLCSYGRSIRYNDRETGSDSAPVSEPAICDTFCDFEITVKATYEYVRSILKSSDKASRFQCVLESVKLFDFAVLQ